MPPHILSISLMGNSSNSDIVIFFRSPKSSFSLALVYSMQGRHFRIPIIVTVLGFIEGLPLLRLGAYIAVGNSTAFPWLCRAYSYTIFAIT